MRSMVIITCQLSGPNGVLHVPVSLPYASQLIDHVKYLEPQDVKPPESDTERRRYRHRGPTLRSLVKLAVANDIAELDTQTFRRRFDRSLQRQGIAPPGRGRAGDGELAERLDRLLVQD